MQKKFLLTLSLIIPLVLFSYTAYNSYGFDDEYFNINLAAKYDSAFELVNDNLRGNFVDIHPFGQFLIDYWLVKLLGSWSLVRVFGALFASLSLWLYWLYVMKRENYSDTLTILFAYVFMCLNPSVLLWCTSVRWYTYFMPLMCLLGSLFTSKSNKYSFWGVYFLTAVIMFYIECCAAIFIVASFILLLVQRRKLLRQEFKTILTLGTLSFIVAARQIYLVIKVYLPHASHEFRSLFNTITQGGQHFLSGHAVMPLSVPGVMLIIANLLLILVFLINIRKVLSRYSCDFFALSYAGLIFTKIGKVRNYINLSGLQGDFLSCVYSCIKTKALKILILALYLVGTAWGIHNVITHTNTTKGSWNTPYKEIIDFIEEYNPEKDFVLASHNPVLNWHAQQHGFKVIDVTQDLQTLKSQSGQVFIIRTYRGSLPRNVFNEFNEHINSRKILLEKKFGRDDFAGFKQRFDKSYPDYYATLIVCE